MLASIISVSRDAKHWTVGVDVDGWNSGVEVTEVSKEMEGLTVVALNIRTFRLETKINYVELDICICF